MKLDARAYLVRAEAGATRASLDAALLAGRGARYVVSRIGLSFARAALRAAVHSVELWFLARSFPLQFLFPLLALRMLPGLLTGLQWGALEGLRARARRETHRAARYATQNAVEAYLMVTLLVVLPTALAVTLYIARIPDPIDGPFGLYGLFTIVTAWATAIELWSRVYYAGVYAHGRVFRPAWSIFLPDVLELVGLVVLWPVLRTFALHAVLLLGALLRASLSFIYARRSYRARRLGAPRVFRPRALRHFHAADLREAVRHALAALPLQLDRVLVIALMRAPAPSGALALALPFYALRPIAGLSQAWARAFYPDFVRLDAAAVGLLRARFERLLRRAALAIGLLASALFTLAAFAMFELRGLVASAFLVPLIVLRASFSLEQLRAFAYGAHRPLVVATLIALAALALGVLLEPRDRTLALGLAALVALMLAIVRRSASTAAQRRRERHARLPLSTFFAHVAAQRQPVRIWIARVDTRIAPAGAIVRAVSRALRADDASLLGHVARAGHAFLVFWEPQHPGHGRAHWVHAAGGALTALSSVDAPSGRQALASMFAVLPPELSSALDTARAPASEADLRRAVAAIVPEAQCIDLAAQGTATAALNPSELAAVRRAILSSAREQSQPSRRSPLHVAVFAPAGEPSLVFVWPRDAAAGGALRRLVRQASWRASF